MRPTLEDYEQRSPAERFLHKFGRNSDIDAGPETIWQTGGLFTFPTAAQTLDLVSSGADAADDDKDAGTGAREITIQGLDANYELVSEAIELEGLTPFTSSVEFVLACRRGSLKYTGNAGRQWWEWPRGAHSAKPEAFLDIVEAVSPGPYLELFARRQRLGWDTWGNEALDHAGIGELSAT